MLTSAAVAKACGAPLANVEANWPGIVQALKDRGAYSRNTLIAAAATVAVETGVRYDADGDGDKDVMTFCPIIELGGTKYLNQMYDRRKDLGNTPALDGDGARNAGRGYIQLTGGGNYRLAEAEVPLPGLFDNPDLALEPDNAAKILAWYFVSHHIPEAADAGQWERVRRKVTGGTNGLGLFLRFVAALEPLWEDDL